MGSNPDGNFRTADNQVIWIQIKGNNDRKIFQLKTVLATSQAMMNKK